MTIWMSLAAIVTGNSMDRAYQPLKLNAPQILLKEKLKIGTRP
jgi:hypothetical protein